MNHRLVFTAYRRPQYFHQVLAAWTSVRRFRHWAPTVFLEPSPVHEVMAGIALQANVSIYHHTTRQGVLHNPWVALDTAFRVGGADYAVLAEDDIVPSDDILEYHEWAAETLRDEHILAVCSASFVTNLRPEQNQQVVPTTQFCPLIWGTWADRWEQTLRDSWDHDYTSGTPDAPSSGWDWNINLRIISSGNWHVVQPWASRCTHIGVLNGEHTTPESFPGSVAATFLQHRDPAPFHYLGNR